jgi:hypothetical protein
VSRGAKLVLLFSLAMNLAVVAAFAYQRSRPAPAAPPPDPFAALALTAEQAAAFERETADFAAYRGGCHGEMSALRAALVGELTAAQPAPAEIDRLLVAMRDRQAATERRLVDHLLALRGLLRPDQQAEFQRVLMRTLAGGCQQSGHQCHHDVHRGAPVGEPAPQ